MDYKEKYEKLLDNANVIYKAGNNDVKQLVEQLFPEIQEKNEGRIKDEILIYLSKKLTGIQQATPSNMQLGKWIGWLKSIKIQKYWKPSDEQMDALEHFVRSIGESGFASPYEGNTNLVYSLLSELKKLK